MQEMSFSDLVGIGGIVLAIILLVLDKAGRLKGGWLFGLLCLAGGMTLFIALGNSWVIDAPSKWKVWRIVFMIAAVALVYSGLTIWISGPSVEVTKQENATPSILEAKKEPIPPAPYAVRIDTTLFSPRRDINIPIFMAYPGLHGETLSLVNAALFLTIVNQQSIPVMLSEYSIEMRTAEGSWAALIRLSAIGKTVYTGSDTRSLARISDNSAFLDIIVVGRTLQPHETIRGWSFFEYPKGYGPTFVPEFKLTLKDYGGTEYISPVLSSTPGEGAQVQGFTIGHGKFDLSKADQKYWGDPAVR